MIVDVPHVVAIDSCLMTDGSVQVLVVSWLELWAVNAIPEFATCCELRCPDRRN